MNLFSCLCWVLTTAIVFVGGVSCASYVTPGGPADFKTFTDPQLKKAYTARPAANFPAHLAMVRVQSNGYRNDETRGFGAGRYCVVTREDIANEGDFERLVKLRGIRDVVRLNQLLVPSELTSDLEIRNAAAKLHTDMMVLYTFNTTFEDRDLLSPLTTISLGLAPTKSFKAKSIASAIVMDTRTGYIYSVLEESADKSGLATAWGDSQAMKQARKKAERDALDKLLESFERTWPRVLRRHS